MFIVDLMVCSKLENENENENDTNEMAASILHTRHEHVLNFSQNEFQ